MLIQLWKWFPIQDSDSPVNLGRKEPHKGLFSILASHNHESLDIFKACVAGSGSCETENIYLFGKEHGT